MAFPSNISKVCEFLSGVSAADFTITASKIGGVKVYSIEDWDETITGIPQPTEQEVITAAADGTVVNGQTFSQWRAENGGDASLTLRRQAKQALDDIQGNSALIRAVAVEFLAEFNRHANRAYASLTVSDGQAASQAITPGSPTIVTLWDGTGAEDRAAADSGAGTITLGDSGRYKVSLSCSYAHTGGADCDMTWGLYAGGAKVGQAQARRKSVSGDAASLSIGPVALSVATDNVVIDVRVEHNESGTRNLVIAQAQCYAERLPTIPERTIAELRTAIKNKISSGEADT